MSPIGRVFICLNLVLAGTFVGFSGTYLQKQHNYKEQLAVAKKAHKDAEDAWTQEKTKLESERAQFELAKSTTETKLGERDNQLAAVQDENKQLSTQLASMEGDMKRLLSTAEASNSQSKAAMDQALAAFNSAKEAQATKDEAVRAKDAAEAENRTLKGTVAARDATINEKDVAIAGLSKEKSELDLLVKVAQQNGFVPGLAAPALNGTVAHVANNRLCTIKITDNPGNVDIQDQLNKRSFSFAIYDASGYKGEAVATSYHAQDNAVTCNLMLTKGTIKEGDKASTKTP